MLSVIHSMVRLIVSLLWETMSILDILSFGTMRASSQGGDFLVSSSLDSLGPVSEVHGVFSNKDLPFIM